MTGSFQITSIHGNQYGLIFIDHFTNTSFNYAMKSEDEFPEFLQQFLIDFRESFKTYKGVELRVLSSDNAGEFNSAEVQQICRNNGIKREFSNPGQQFQNGKTEKCIGDVWLMTKTTLLFSNVSRALWDEAWFNASYVKTHLPTTANEGFKSPIDMSNKYLTINLIHEHTRQFTLDK
jgi:transposase InsO family protein